MSSLHWLNFALWVPHFVPSNNLPHKHDRVRLKGIYDLLRCSDASCTIMICQPPWDPSCRHLRHLQTIMDYGFHASTWNLHCSRNLQYFYSPVISDQFLHSSNYRWINSVRRPARPQVIFDCLTSTPKLIWPSGNCAVRLCTVPIHGTQSIMNLHDLLYRET